MPAASDDPIVGVTRENPAAPPLDYEQYFREHRPKLLLYALRTAENTQQGEDAVQEAMIAAYGRWSKVSIMANPGGWVAKVISRRLSRRRRPREDPLLVDGTAVDESSERLTEKAEIWDAVGELPPRQREIVAMRFGLDMDITEIAAQLGIKESTVRSNLSRAMRRLEALLTAGREGRR